MTIVSDFVQSFYVPVPTGFGPQDLEPFRERINRLLGNPNAVPRISMAQKPMRANGELKPLLKIYVVSPDQLHTLQVMLSSGLSQYRNLFGHFQQTFEGRVPYITGFIRETQVQAMSWVRLDPGTYRTVDCVNKRSTCQIEVSVSYQNLKVFSEEDEATLGLPVTAPLRILSFDIETMIPEDDGVFPYPEGFPVLQISNTVSHRPGDSTHRTDPVMRTLFVLNDCLPIRGVQALCFATERELLAAWGRFILDTDPDVVLGYNSGRFDLPFLLARAQVLNLATFGQLGRLKEPCLSYPPWDRSSKEPESARAPLIPGRITLDLFNYIARRNSPEGTSKALGAVAQRILGETKVDFDFRLIPVLQNGGPDNRRLMAIYCLKDAYLVQRLLDNTPCLLQNVRDARNASIPMEWLLTRSQHLKAYRDLEAGKIGGYVVVDP
ncbi:delta DNA polymerase, variant 3 [Coprinopsis cinerea AmutBmut pab1-1]|nr:delta DNA polymerase, variant 3 [Coprinopsis cinerea AmutBmut pab1-1]